MDATPVRGIFCWHDLASTDPDASQAFYAALFGWEIQDVPLAHGVYRMIHAGGEGQGGIEPLQQAGVPSHWIGYVTVADVDKAAAIAAAHGGHVHQPPTDIPQVGRFAVVADPSGAVIAPFRSAHGDLPEAAAPRTPGQFCYDELLTRDAGACGPFYTQLFEWRQHSMDMGHVTYHLFKRRNDQDGAGMMAMPPEARAPSHWLPYIAVDDVDATCERAVGLGAVVYKQPDDIPHVGRFAVLGDPQGASFAVFKGTAHPR